MRDIIKQKLEQISLEFTSLIERETLGENNLEQTKQGITNLKNGFSFFLEDENLQEFHKSTNDKKWKGFFLSNLSQYCTIDSLPEAFLYMNAPTENTVEHSNSAVKIDSLETLKKNSELEQVSYQGMLNYQLKALNKYQETIKKLGYTSIFEAYMDIYNLDLSILERMEKYLEDTKEEFQNLFHHYIKTYLDPDFTLEDLTNGIEQYKGRWLMQGHWLYPKYSKYFGNYFINKINQFLQDAFLYPEEKQKIISKCYSKPNIFTSEFEGYTIYHWDKNHKFDKIRVFYRNPSYIRNIKTFIHETGHAFWALMYDRNHSSKLIDKMIWENATSEFSAHIFESFVQLNGFWKNTLGITLEEEKELIKYFRFRHLLLSRYHITYFLSIYSLIRENERISRRILREGIKNFEKLSLEHISYNRKGFNLLSNTYFYRLDIARATLEQETLLKKLDYNFKDLINIKPLISDLFFKGQNERFIDLKLNFFNELNKIA